MLYNDEKLETINNEIQILYLITNGRSRKVMLTTEEENFKSMIDMNGWKIYIIDSDTNNLMHYIFYRLLILLTVHN